MKRTYSVVIFLVCICFSYSQEKDPNTILRVESNGVVVYKPIGVEHTLGIKSETVFPVAEERVTPFKTIDDLSMEELEEKLYYINLKLEKAINEDSTDDIIRYKEEKHLTEGRIRNNKQLKK